MLRALSYRHRRRSSEVGFAFRHMHPAFSPLPIPYDKTFHATTAEHIAASTKRKIHGGPSLHPEQRQTRSTEARHSRNVRGLAERVPGLEKATPEYVRRVVRAADRQAGDRRRPQCRDYQKAHEEIKKLGCVKELRFEK